MNIDKETERSIQELQLLEQNIQNLLLQKQAFQIELSETTNAAEELKKSKDDAFRIVGQIMLKADRAELEKELEEKKKLLNLRISSIEKQEDLIAEKTEKLRQEITKKLK
ncbi:MAG TPA: prefoldin subunit [Candidatus Nanoarchaeia archaeon]|nr:prefoldin subunit [Candidatus Nanoarchaeia archaeon]